MNHVWFPGLHAVSYLHAFEIQLKNDFWEAIPNQPPPHLLKAILDLYASLSFPSTLYHHSYHSERYVFLPSQNVSPLQAGTSYYFLSHP